MAKIKMYKKNCKKYSPKNSGSTNFGKSTFNMIQMGKNKHKIDQDHAIEKLFNSPIFLNEYLV